MIEEAAIYFYFCDSEYPVKKRRAREFRKIELGVIFREFVFVFYQNITPHAALNAGPILNNISFRRFFSPPRGLSTTISGVASVYDDDTSYLVIAKKKKKKPPRRPT